MLQIFPFVGWLALITSIVLLAALFWLGDLRSRTLVALGVWWIVAAYAQLFGRTPNVAAAGLGLQTILSVYLIIRWRLNSV